MMRPLQLKAPWQPSLATFPDPTVNPGAFNAFRLAYPYRLNQQYSLETTTDVAAGNWAPMTGPNVPRPFLDIPNRRWLQTPIPSENPRRFYRIQPVRPQP